MSAMNCPKRHSCLEIRILFPALLACHVIALAAHGAEPAGPEKKTESPPVQVVARGVLKSKLQLDAVFEAAEMAPVKISPKVWADLTVSEIVSHGARVRKGDWLVKLETDKIEEQIRDLEQEQPLTKVALELGVAELENLKQSTPLKLEAAKRSQRRADEDYDYFEATGRAQREKVARFGVKSSEQRLENEREELAQLQKMYQADDLTEETEEIILKRQKFAVEAAEHSLEGAKLNADRELKTSIPREDESLKSQQRDQDLALTLAEQSLPKALAKKRLEIKKMKRDQKKSERRLADLKRDLDGLTARAPMEGITYYGACENGRWTTGAALAKKLVPGGKLAANEVFMTIVNPQKLLLKAVVPENELSRFKLGLEGQASPVSAPDKKLAAKLEDVSYVPLLTGGFEARLSVQQDENAHLMPGMTCKVSFGDVQKAGVLLAPKEAVITEGNQKHVFVLTNDGQHEKRTVKTGDSDDKMIEILEGLAEGEKILVKKPE